MKKICNILVLLLLCVVLAGCSNSKGSVIVGAKDYTEQHILGNILAQLIAHNTLIEVTLKTDMGSEMIFAGISTDQLDLYVEYTGTVYANHLKYYDSHSDFGEAPSSDAVFETSRRVLAEDYNIRVLDKLGFNNTFALAVRADMAAVFNLDSISDLAKVSSNLIFGGGNEILSRSDGIPTLKILYDMHFKREVVLNGNDRYFAIANDEVHVIAAFSTDGMLLEYSLVVLDDDKNFFPPYHAVPIIREEIAEKYPEIVDVISELTGLITDDIMRSLNYKVDVHGQDPAAVAEEFLRENNLLK